MPIWNVTVHWDDRKPQTFETNAQSALDAADAGLELIYTCVDRQDEYQISRVGIRVAPAKEAK